MSKVSAMSNSSLRELLRLAWPLMLAQIATALYDIADGYFLARHSSAAMIASLPARMVAGTLTTFFICSIGYVSTFIAQFHGGGDGRKALCYFAQGLWMALFVAPVFLLLIPLSYFVVGLAGHSSAVDEAERAYLLIAAPGGLFTLLNVVLSGFFAGQGRTRYISTCYILGCIANFFADWALVPGIGPLPALGITGAAIATVIGNALTAAMLAVAVLRDGLFRRYACAQEFVPQPKRMWEILRLGVPTGVTSFAASFAFMVFSLVLTGFDEMSTNAANALFRVNNIFYMALCATSDSVLILTGRCRGAGDDQGAYGAYGAGLRTIFIAQALSFIAMFSFSDTIFDFFRPTDATYDQSAYHCLGFILLCIMFLRELAEGVMCLTVGALRGVGDTKFVMCTQMTADLCLWMPFVLYIGKSGGSIIQLWLSMPINMALIAIVLSLRWYGGKWRSKTLVS